MEGVCDTPLHGKKEHEPFPQNDSRAGKKYEPFQRNDNHTDKKIRIIPSDQPVPCGDVVGAYAIRPYPDGRRRDLFRMINNLHL